MGNHGNCQNILLVSSIFCRVLMLLNFFLLFRKRNMPYYIRHIFPIRSYSPALLRILLRRTPSPGRTTLWRGSLSQSGGRTRPKVRKDRATLIYFLFCTCSKELSLDNVFWGNLFSPQFSIDIISYFFEQTKLICFIAEVEGDDPFRRGGRPGGRPGDPSVDRRIDRSIGNWSSLPRAPDQEVILLKKARGKINKFLTALKCFPTFCP